MKHRKKFDLYKFFTISAIVIGIGFFLTSLILSRIVFKEKQEGETPKEKAQAPSVSQGVTQLSDQRSLVSREKDIDAGAAPSEKLDDTESPVEDVQTLSSTTDETPLSYEEQLKQRWLQFKETPEFKEINGRSNELTMKIYESLEAASPLQRKWYVYDKNPFSVFGVKKEEAYKREWSEEELQFMREEGKRIRQQLDEDVARRRAYAQEQKELHQRMLDLLGMTREEYYTAIGRTPPQPPPPKVSQ